MNGEHPAASKKNPQSLIYYDSKFTRKGGGKGRKVSRDGGGKYTDTSKWFFVKDESLRVDKSVRREKSATTDKIIQHFMHNPS